MEETAISAFIRRELMRSSRGEQSSPLENLIERGVIDSLGIVRLLAYLEQSFSIRINDEELLPEHFESVAAIVSLVRRKRAGTA